MPKAKLTNTFVNKAKCPKDKTKKYRFQTHWGKLFLNFLFPLFVTNPHTNKNSKKLKTN